MDTQLPLTVVVLTLNEKERMERCLASLAFASQVVIMDSFSTDGTLTECARLWRKWNRPQESLVLIEQEWLGFEKMRNLSRKFAAFEWILWVDADERISSELKSELREIFGLLGRNGCWVYRMPRLTYFLGRPIYHGGWYPDRKRRLAHRDKAEWRLGPHGADVHEDLFAVGGDPSVGELKNHIFHETFRNVHEQEETNNRYSTLLAEGLAKTYLAQKRNPPTLFYVYIKVFIKFIENYFFKLGILDAYPGFLIAKGSAKSLLMRYKKLIALLSQNSKAQAT